MSSSPTPLQIEQIHLALSAVVISSFSVSCLPEAVVYLTRRWMSYNLIDNALLWVPVVERELIPLVRALVPDLRLDHDHDIAITSVERKIVILEDATARYVQVLCR